MDPKRRAEIDAYFNSMGRGPHAAGITPPTPEEFEEWQRGQSSGTRLEDGSVQRHSPRVSNMDGQITGPYGREITDSGQRATIKNTNITKGTIKPTGTTSTGPTEAHGANLPRDTQATRAARGGTTTTTGTTTSRGSGSSSSTTTTGGGEPPRERSAWSDFLHQAMEEAQASGDMRSLRIPFEQHPRQVFDRYQNVAQPGFGRPVPNMMPGQVPSQRGPMPAPMMDPRMQAMSPTMAPGSPTMTNFSNAMQRVQPMMARPMQNSFPPNSMPDPRFSAQPMAQPNMPNFQRSYSPPPSYRTSAPNDAQAMMDEFRRTGSLY